ncbi:hypothetical protein ANO14919_046630 [Xylariales sp. No.14919]|nr:hypothetical protein ANO14919_046630 [Xylariales sp. No.14919]
MKAYGKPSRHNRTRSLIRQPVDFGTPGGFKYAATYADE